MKQWQIVDREKVALCDVPKPEPGPGEVLVKIMACSFCSRTDLVYWKYFGIKTHCTGAHFGHEVSGVVEEVGTSITRWKPGDRVFLRGPSRGSGFAEYCLAREIQCGRLPEHVSFIEGAPVQQVPIAVHGTRKVQVGDLVVIFGAGSAGLALLQMARLRGAARIVSLDLFDNRLELAKELGADFTINVRRQDPLKTIRELLGQQPDVVIDAVGIPSVAHQCIELVKTEGNVTIFGSYHVEQEVTFDLIQWEYKAITVNMANEGSDHSLTEAMRITERLLESGRVATKPYITHVLGFEDVPKGLELLASSPLLFPESDFPSDLPWNREVIKIVVSVQRV